jgi:hypothetical protein
MVDFDGHWICGRSEFLALGQTEFLICNERNAVSRVLLRAGKVRDELGLNLLERLLAPREVHRHCELPPILNRECLLSAVLPHLRG